jgi:large subunit ribosomal protein L6
MKLDTMQSEAAIPEGVSISCTNGVYVAKGPQGELTRRLYHPRINASVADGTITLTATNVTRREKKILFTHTSHVKNLIKGVAEGYEYKLKVCSGHFPMTVAVKGAVLEIKNFIGEAVPRTVKIDPRTKITVEGDLITVTGTDLEATSQMAASIEQKCRRTGFDRRIFQDGIYITHKDGNEV